jgi:hypothetical protein
MRKLLLISLEFPPIQVAGAFRALRFATHLPKFGIQPVVVCFNPKQFANNKVHTLNPKLGELIPAQTPIYHLDVSVLESSRAKLSPLKAAESSAPHCFTMTELFDTIKAEHQIEFVYVTCPPFNADTLAIAAKQYFKRPMVLDMRDAWSQWGTAPFRTYFHYRKTMAREQQLLRTADAVTSVTPQLIEMERRVAGREATHGYHWVPNAYDQVSLPSGELRVSPQKMQYKVAYAGQFYFSALHETPTGIVPWYRKKPHRWLHYHATRQRWIYRTPYFFFRAWHKFRELFPQYQDRFQFHYLGYMEDWLLKMADSFGLTEYCVWHGFKSKQDTKQIFEDSDMCLSTSIKIENGEDYCLASKTFDYICAKKPALAFVSPGMQQDFLLGSNIAYMCDPDDTTGSAQRLRDLIEKGFSTSICSSYLEQFSAEATSQKMAEVILSMSPAETSRT